MTDKKGGGQADRLTTVSFIHERSQRGELCNSWGGRGKHFLWKRGSMLNIQIYISNNREDVSLVPGVLFLFWGGGGEWDGVNYFRDEKKEGEKTSLR